MIAGTRGAMREWDTKKWGYCTVIRLLAGAKLWTLQEPMKGDRSPLPSLSEERSSQERLMVHPLLLVEGDEL